MRMSAGKFDVNHEIGREYVTNLGLARPYIGAIFALLLYFAVQGRPAPQIRTPTDGAGEFAFFVAFGFLIGFSERFAKEIVRSAEAGTGGAAARRRGRRAGRRPSRAGHPGRRVAPPAPPPAGRREDRAPAAGAGAGAAGWSSWRGGAGAAAGGRRLGRLARRVVEQMRVALLLLPRPARQAHRQLAVDQALQGGDDRREVAQRVQALGALLELARRLRAAEHEHAQHRELVLGQPERLVEQVAVLGRAAARVRWPGAPSAAATAGAARRGRSPRRTRRPDRGWSPGCTPGAGR